MLRCPKCASPDVRAIPVFEGDHRRLHGLPREAARPRRRRTPVWLAVAVVSGFLLSQGSAGAMLSSVAFGAVALGGAWGAHRARAFNSRAFPLLMSTWERSKICTRCGAVIRDDNGQWPVTLFDGDSTHTEPKEGSFRISR